MKTGLLFFALLLSSKLLNAQLYFSAQYYQDSIRFTDRRSAAYDASDVLNSWDEFVRFKIDFPIGENYRINSWMDFNSGLTPQNARVGLLRKVGKHFGLEANGKILSYWEPYQDEMPNADGYDYYYRLVAVGVAPVFTYRLGRFSLDASLEYSRAITETEQMDYSNRTINNFRSLDHYEFQLKNYQSLYAKIGLAVDIIQTNAFSIGLLYQFISRNDFYKFDYTHQRYELTYSNIVESGSDSFKQANRGLQHHLGVRVTMFPKN